MKRRIGYGLAFAMAAAGLAAVGWPGAAANPATLINRVDVIAILLMLAVLPWLARSRFGPVRDSRLTRIVRIGGCLALFVLVVVKDDVERFKYGALPGRSWLAGLWAGEILFLVVTAIYLTGLLAVTARRTPARPAVLATGVCAGAGAGLVVFALPPVGNPLHVTRAWLAVMHGLGWGVAVPLVLGGGIVAGLMAARKAAGRSGQTAMADVRARQGTAAGLCAGAAAALLVSVAGVSAAALLPHQATHFQAATPGVHRVRNPQIAIFLDPQHVPSSLAAFEASLGDSAAGYLLVLLCFPLIGAGLGAWGGICAAGRRSDGGGGGGGGGGEGPPSPEPPAPGGRRLDPERQPSVLSGYLLDLPGLADLTGSQEEQPAAPGHREKVPAGAQSGPGNGLAQISPPLPDRAHVTRARERSRFGRRAGRIRAPIRQGGRRTGRD
ncbi:MAG TPA: hypothetical protein VMF87_20805 [Streptosporangiaceae bacterium]|nr:hypothetical protein [Streptosporangiaceae bacterium]